MGTRADVLIAIPRQGGHFAQLWNADAQAAAERNRLRVGFIDRAPDGPAAWQAALAACDAVITTWGAPRFDVAILPAGGRLRVLAHAAGSVADLVSPELYDRGIQVVSANPIMAEAVAEWSLQMCLLGRSRLLTVAGIGGAMPLRWQAREGFRSLHGARIGIWGYGAVARNLVRLLRPLRPRAIAIAPDYDCAAELAADGLAVCDLDALFADCDVVVLAAGLNPANVGRVGAAQLQRLQPGACVVNCGRARLVDEAALIAAAQAGGATFCLDVFHHEPPPPEHPLLACANVVCTPHVAGHGTMAAFVPGLLERLGTFFDGRPLPDAITRERALTMTSHALTGMK